MLLLECLLPSCANTGGQSHPCSKKLFRSFSTLGMQLKGYHVMARVECLISHIEQFSFCIYEDLYNNYCRSGGNTKYSSEMEKKNQKL